MLFALLFSLTSITSLARAQNAAPTAIPEARLAEAAEAPHWKKLLHYNRFFPWSTLRGEVDGEGFYLSPEGRDNPLAELRATIAALEADQVVGKNKQKATCAFPERLRYLQQAVGLAVKRPPAADCPHYQAFVGAMNPQGVALVFSSAFASNPGSMFGHTFLKILTDRKSDLLDKGISFAATVPKGEGGFFYVMLGLMGGYPGQYSFLSYHEKVQEYINAESRDLWEYGLDFTPEESRRLVDHLWELESNSWFDYYFINKNCSYQLLTAIEVVKPQWDLSSGWLWVVPAETIKRVAAVPGAVTALRYRPSLRNRMIQDMDALAPDDRREFTDLISLRTPPAKIASPTALSVGLEYIQYHRAESTGTNRTDLLALWDETLQRRSELPPGPKRDAYQAPPAGHPEMGHGPIRLSLSQGASLRTGGTIEGFQEFHVRPAYHDLMNDDLGYPRFSEIDFPNVTFRLYPGVPSFTLERLQFMSMVSIFPLDFLEKRLSWKVNLELFQAKDLVCPECRLFRAEMAWGASLRLFSEDYVAYALGGGYVDVGSGLQRIGRLGPEADAGLLLNPFRPYKLRGRLQLNGDLFQPYRPPLFATVSADQSLSFGPHWESRLELRDVFSFGSDQVAAPSFYEGKLSLLYYF